MLYCTVCPIRKGAYRLFELLLLLLEFELPVIGFIPRRGLLRMRRRRFSLGFV